MFTFIIYWLALFAVLILACSLILRRLRIFNYGATLAAAHFMLMCLVALSVHRNLNDGQARITWFIADLLDFPTSVLLGKIKTVLASVLGADFAGRVVFAPLLFHGLLGSLQFLGIGLFIDHHRRKKRSSLSGGMA